MSGVFNMNFDFVELDEHGVQKYKRLINSPANTVIDVTGQAQQVPQYLLDAAAGQYRRRLGRIINDENFARRIVFYAAVELVKAGNWALFKAWCRLQAGESYLKAEELFWAVGSLNDDIKALIPSQVREDLYSVEWPELDEWGM